MNREYQKGGKTYRPDKMTKKQKDALKKKDPALYSLMFKEK